MPYTSSINVITPILKFEIFYKHVPCSIGLQAQFDCRLRCFEYCTLNSMPINVWKPTGLCQDLSVVMRNACSCFEALTLSCETVIKESRLSEWHPDHHLINMPGPVPAAVKARRTLRETRINIQKALQGSLNTQDQKPPPSQDAISSQFGAARSALSARIRDSTSKLASRSQ